MYTPVQFYDQIRLFTIEVGYISSKRMLAAKFRAHESSVSQPAPKRFLDGGRLPAQTTGNPDYMARCFRFFQDFPQRGTPRPPGEGPGVRALTPKRPAC